MDCVNDWPVTGEDAARAYLHRICGDDDSDSCPRCGSSRVYRLNSGRRRCAPCRYTFSEFAGRWLACSRIDCRDWIALVSLFERESSPAEIARELGRAYATAFHAVTVVRAGILAHSSAGNVLSRDDALALPHVCAHRGRKALEVGGHVPVFGICETSGWVAVPALLNTSPEQVLRLAVKKVRRGNIVYTGRIGRYDALIFSMRSRSAVSRTPFACSPAYIDRASGFWAYARPRLTAHRGVSPEHFPLYLEELAFRYNHRDAALAPILLRYLCDFVPRAEHQHPGWVTRQGTTTGERSSRQ